MFPGYKENARKILNITPIIIVIVIAMIINLL